jgi:hypothetical protein
MNKVNYRFYVDKDCNWFQDDKPITHRGIYNFNYKNLKISDDGEFFVQEGNSKAFVKFEDKPFLVRSVDLISRNQISLNLNDSTIEKLDVQTLYFENNIPYCKIKEKLFDAKFSRPALYQISQAIDLVDEKYFIGETLINQK